jgi:transposase
MPAPLSLDLRQRILHDGQAGMRFADAGRTYSVSAECVRQLARRFQATGEIAPRSPANQVVPFHRRHEDRIRAAVAGRPGLTLAQLRAQLGLDVSVGTLWEALRKLRLTFQKRRSTRPSKRGPMSSPDGPSSTSSASPASTRTA